MGLNIKTDNLALNNINSENDFSKIGFLQIIKENDFSDIPKWVNEILDIKQGTIVHAPLFSAGIYQGSCFVVSSKYTGFSSEEQEAIRMLSDQVGVALQNMCIYREKEELLFELLTALTRAIDAKSKWTSGHSERVAEYALLLGKSINLSDKDLESIKMSSLVHDIGKIATPETILDKPGKLTDEEFTVIKKHPEEGARIIGGIKSYGKIVPGILYHHEHWDGSGYPESLMEKSIPLISRIITIADVFDAISADRPYRKGMSYDEAYKFMLEMSGRLFDPELLEKFHVFAK